jgi:hypothetical protein
MTGLRRDRRRRGGPWRPRPHVDAIPGRLLEVSLTSSKGATAFPRPFDSRSQANTTQTNTPGYRYGSYYSLSQHVSVRTTAAMSVVIHQMNQQAPFLRISSRFACR